MNTYEMTKTFTNAKVKATAKADFTEALMTFLKETYGEDSVAMVRTGTSTSAKNEIAVKFATVSANGDELDLCVTLNPTVKEFENRQTAKKTYEAFDFEAARDCYNDYVDEKAATEKEKKAKKDAKIEKDEIARKKKSEETGEDF